MSYVFISYSRKDRDFAENVKNRLERAGLETWMDEDIRAGKEWRMQIDEAIKNAFVMVVIMTPEAKSSEYVTYEWSFAVGVGIRLIPVKRKQTVLHPRLEAYQFLDFTNDNYPWERLIEEVREAEKMPQAAAASVVGSSSMLSFIDQAREALNRTNADMRKDAICTLAQANSSEAQEVLIEALVHPVADVRETAAIALGEKRCEQAVPRLIELLFDANQEVRMAAIASLTDIKDARTIPAFLELLNLKETSEAEKNSIIEALSFFGDTSVVPTLLALYERASEAVRKSSIQTLGNLGAVAAIPLLQVALYDPAASICSSAAQVLLQLQVDEGLDALVPTLLTMNKIQCEAIVKALSSSPLDKIIARLDDVYQKHCPDNTLFVDKEKAAKVRRRVIWLLRVLENRGAIPVLIRSMDDDDSVVQQETVYAFKVMQDQRALPALMTILRWRFEYYDEKTLLYAIQALYQVGNASVIPQLKAVLTEMLEKHLELALQVIAVFGKLGNHETIDYLRNVNANIKRNGMYEPEKKRELGEAIDQAIQDLRSRL